MAQQQNWVEREFIFETDSQFDGYEFMKEFSKLRAEGHFKGVKHVRKLDFEPKNVKGSKARFIMEDVYKVK